MNKSITKVEIAFNVIFIIIEISVITAVVLEFTGNISSWAASQIVFGGASYTFIYNWYLLKRSKEKFKRIFSVVILILGIISFIIFIVGFIY